jgi:thiamine biosynthesis lipoprotein
VTAAAERARRTATLRPQPHRAAWPALGTTAVLAVSDPGALDAAREEVEQEIAAIDLACSRFRADSELSRLNAAGGRPRPASPLLREAIAAGIRAWALTDGDVSPTLGAALVLAGYDRDFASLRADGGPTVDQRSRSRTSSSGNNRDPIATVRVERHPGAEAIELDEQRGVVRLARGVQLDLGATAKALAADRAAAAAHRRTGAGVLVSLGGDIALAGPAPADGWVVRVTDDHAAGERDQPVDPPAPAPGESLIRLLTGGLATSSVVVRRWRRDGEERHHLIDPRTGRPAAVTWRTASVAAASCLDANIASTATMIRGPRAVAWLTELGLPARLQPLEGEPLLLAGWPAAAEAITPR